MLGDPNVKMSDTPRAHCWLAPAVNSRRQIPDLFLQFQMTICVILSSDAVLAMVFHGIQSEVLEPFCIYPHGSAGSLLASQQKWHSSTRGFAVSNVWISQNATSSAIPDEIVSETLVSPLATHRDRRHHVGRRSAGGGTATVPYGDNQVASGQHSHSL
jgi:hypothetical protein